MNPSYLLEATFRRSLREILEQQETARGRFLPPRLTDTALLVIDMQDYFLDPASHACVPGAAQALAGTRALCAAFGRQRRPIIFTRHLNTPEDAGMLGEWWADLIRPSAADSRISAQLETTGHAVIQKTQYDAFHRTDLETRLRALGIRRVAICGVVTHLCCETTARAAFVRGFAVLLACDATAAYDPEFHLASLRNLGHGFATLATVDELVAGLEAA